MKKAKATSFECKLILCYNTNKERQGTSGIMTNSILLLDHIDKVHTTELGGERIKRNLKLDTDDVVTYCKEKITNSNCMIYRQGKNWYCEIEDIKITVNAHSYTIITAHKIQ